MLSCLIATCLLVPNIDTSFKAYMDYRTITNTESAQYKLQQDCWTDENGLRRQTDDYVVAMGTYYSNTIGDRFEITLDNGNNFTVIIGDIKADKHTDSKNMYYPMGDGKGNVIEFIVDAKKLDKTAKNWGDISAIDFFDGEIEEIKKL